jgi:hypothetical protein
MAMAGFELKGVPLILIGSDMREYFHDMRIPDQLGDYTVLRRYQRPLIRRGAAPVQW